MRYRIHFLKSAPKIQNDSKHNGIRLFVFPYLNGTMDHRHVYAKIRVQVGQVICLDKQIINQL